MATVDCISVSVRDLQCYILYNFLVIGSTSRLHANNILLNEQP